MFVCLRLACSVRNCAWCGSGVALLTWCMWGWVAFALILYGWVRATDAIKGRAVAPVLSLSCTILFTSFLFSASVLCYAVSLNGSHARLLNTHTRSSCKFLIFAFRRFLCVSCPRAKNMLRALFLAPRMGAQKYHSVLLVNRNDLVLTYLQRLASSRFQNASAKNVPRRQTFHSSPHLQIAHNIDQSLMVAQFLPVWPGKSHRI